MQSQLKSPMKSKLKTDHILPTYNGTGYIHYHFQVYGKEHSKEILDQSKTKNQFENSKLCISMSDVKMFFRSPTPFSFVDCNTLLSLGLVPLPVSSSPWQVSHGSGISNILGSPRQSRLHLHSFSTMASLGLHAGTPLTHT